MADGEETLDLTERQRSWLKHLHAWNKRGGSMASYAEAQGLEVSEFYHWKRWLTKKGAFKPSLKRVRFQSVKVIAPIASVPAKTSASGGRLHLPNGALLEWSGFVSVEDLAALVKVAGGLP